MLARSRSLAAATTSAALGPSLPMRMSSGPSRRNEKPRSAWSSCMEDTPRSNTTPSTLSQPAARAIGFEIGEAVLDQREPAVRGRHEIGAERERMRVAVDGDDLAIRGVEDCARVAAGAEGGVDIDAAVFDIEEVERGAAEHGNVGGWSASDSGKAVAAHRHSRAPSALRAAAWELSSALSARTFWVASASSL